MRRSLLIVANWKMNPVPEGAFDVGSPYWGCSDVDVIVFPTHLDLRQCVGTGLITGAQCGRAEKPGPFTGDVSMEMIAECGARYVLCGHSERRRNHGETNEQVAAQAIAALEAGLHPIVCIGETKAERDQGKHEKVIEEQMKGLPLHSSELTIAYEPVWAIGEEAERAATAEEAQEMHEFIRGLFDAEHSDVRRIIYGGNVNADNAEKLLAHPDIDGGLVGGASLKPDLFRQIVEAAIRLSVGGGNSG